MILTHRPGELVGVDRFPSPAEFPDSPYAQALKEPLLLGLFLPIQAGGWSASTLPRTTDWRFEYNRDLVLKAESLGFNLVFALSQWLPKGGYGGVFDGNALDSFMTTASLTAITSRIHLISTIHVLYGPLHPLHLAKWGATLDHICGGRWGINIVTGHRAVEHEMFGWPRIEHDHRYTLASEFIEVVQKLWTADDNYSFEGISSWKMHGGFVTPKPRYGRPLLVNATGSDAGISFAARYSDLVFITSPGRSDFQGAIEALPPHTARVKRAARDIGREVRTLLNPMVISRETEKETRQYYDAIVAHADNRTPRGFHSFDSDAHAWKGREGKDAPARRAVGGNIEVVGTPEQVVEQFIQLKRAGVDGLQLSFFDFKPDLEFFGDRILPLMKQAGLRL
ncbi:LLM class flavin-dependent oxidoreductase [Caldimonas thermodepolymerans]|jgi:FMNH2-dependent dimethyl sulfone monooxygenase|uniref:LLM class flavin-dependent oxidoreductase n=1 Tax=Caldimonas thermodepolymerans TaxID=215580 RepID=A0A2S5T7Z1_9BURK|nr:LLM class flavin-dependent oxidoreductase [Caldimonas thermodepolymerans]PPE71103.1 LLM class flavin-dependent oxidoreductase [Caldimonas thermodepolymerans]QPC31406.1 LLM class flavin-dependent oxidoreductase [Caldimonas thermodepolymerans]RDH99625.1 FMNH2-dependent dimethyl sulfone monooxygenase [Caldimonas thermodepolymerans]